MADIYEVAVALDLGGDLSEGEIAELQWHLGAGPEPGRLGIVREFPVVVVNDFGEPVVENEPAPLLAGRGAAWKVGGVLTSELVRQADGWALTARQEVHPDDWDRLGELLGWLAVRASDRHQRADGSVHVGSIRFYEADKAEPLTVRGGRTAWPEGI
ncbi:hypothetical protein AB0O76_38430 [Streptomyces sp. NPDC086554]|uniref:hypothetical protein n=1 Tax=Streptomyces sp. NPDC086554 TaxID=3154864 RepID=UPI003429A3A9